MPINPINGGFLPTDEAARKKTKILKDVVLLLIGILLFFNEQREQVVSCLVSKNLLLEKKFVETQFFLSIGVDYCL